MEKVQIETDKLSQASDSFHFILNLLRIFLGLGFGFELRVRLSSISDLNLHLY